PHSEQREQDLHDKGDEHAHDERDGRQRRATQAQHGREARLARLNGVHGELLMNRPLLATAISAVLVIGFAYLRARANSRRHKITLVMNPCSWMGAAPS